MNVERYDVKNAALKSSTTPIITPISPSGVLYEGVIYLQQLIRFKELTLHAHCMVHRFPCCIPQVLRLFISNALRPVDSPERACMENKETRREVLYNVIQRQLQ